MQRKKKEKRMNRLIKSLGKQSAELKYLREETTEEKYMKIEISEVEKKNLWRVFKILCGDRRFREEETKWFNGTDIRRVLKKLGIRNVSQQKIDIMVWVV